MAQVFDDRGCILGEGALWHPEREQLFWFDILEGKLLSRSGGKPHEWRFEEMVSAAGWVDRSRLLIASETSLFLFDLDTGAAQEVVPLEADNMETRSNDGRADPFGGFWIGTMGRDAAPQAGAIYRWFDGRSCAASTPASPFPTRSASLPTAAPPGFAGLRPGRSWPSRSAPTAGPRGRRGC
ncbi:MAG: SMP-30/gluconolactonase/LRE family protein [Paracoccaceae bacterium]